MRTLSSLERIRGINEQSCGVILMQQCTAPRLAAWTIETAAGTVPHDDVNTR